MRFAIGTFNHPRRRCRSDAYLGPPSTFSRAQMERVLAEREESQDYALAVEAAGNLLRLQLDEFKQTQSNAKASGRKDH